MSDYKSILIPFGNNILGVRGLKRSLRSLTVNGDAGVDVTVIPEKSVYDDGEKVVIVAAPKAGYTMEDSVWTNSGSDELVGSGSVRTLNITERSTINIESQVKNPLQISISQKKLRCEIGKSFSISPSCYNITGETVVYSYTFDGVSSLPISSAFSTSTGAFSYYTGRHSIGSHILIITATAGVYTSSETVSIEVIDYILDFDSSDLIYKDDFEDEDITNRPDSSYFSWTVLSGKAAEQERTNGTMLGLTRDNTFIISDQIVESFDFTVYFEFAVIYSVPLKLVMLYQDASNYYYLAFTRDFTYMSIVRVMDGVEAIVGVSPSTNYIIAHTGWTWGGIKVHVLVDSSSISFDIGVCGRTNSYSFSIEDDDSGALSVFGQGKIGFHDTTDYDDQDSAWSFIKCVYVWEGKQETIAPDKRIYYVSKLGNDNNDGLSEETPLLTISAALGQAMYSDEIYVGEGEYQETLSFFNNGQESDGIVISALEPLSPPSILGTIDLYDISYSGGIFSCSLADTVSDVISTPVFQNGEKLSISSYPKVSDPYDPYDSSDWLAVTESSVLTPGSPEETAMLAANIEYLFVDSYFQQSDDYWNGAYLYQYDLALFVAVRRLILDYDSSLNRITVAKSTTYRITSGDKYAIVNHIGVLDNAGEYVLSASELKFKPLASEPIIITIPNKTNAFDIQKDNISIDGFTIKGYLGEAVTNNEFYCKNISLDNLIIRDATYGLFFKSGDNLSVENTEVLRNHYDGINFSQGCNNLIIQDCVIRYNGNNGIWVGGGTNSLYACENVLIKDSIIEEQGVRLQHPDNLQFHQVNNLVMDGCYVKQNGTDQNMWWQFSGEMVIKNCQFIDGALGFNGARNLSLYNNVLKESVVRFDAYNASTTSGDGVSPILITTSSVVSWDLMRDSIKEDGDTYPYNLVWYEESDADWLDTIRGWTGSETITDSDMKTDIVNRINAVVNDLEFFKDNLFIYDLLGVDGPAKEIWDTMITRGLLLSDGSDGPNYTSTYEVEKRGLNRVILDEILFTGILYKSIQNYRSRIVTMKNNAVINCWSQTPPTELLINFYSDYNYYNLPNAWTRTTWGLLNANKEPNDILVTDLADVYNQFVDYDNYDYHLKEGSDLIDAGTDVGADYNSPAPDIGCYEYEG